jgi:Tfp pilus assembly protein PilF
MINLDASTAPPPAQPGFARLPVSPWWLALLLGTVTLALYLPLLHCDFINYDDPDYITANPRMTTGLTLDNVAWAFTTGQAGNWHPLTWLSLMLDASLFGPGAAGFHFTNLLLHTANTLLLFGWLFQLTGAKWRAAAVAALFAWHPVHVESVAWVSERKDVLSTAFGFLTLWLYIIYFQSGEESKVRPARGRIWYGLSLLAFALGLLSKPMLVTWPAVLLLLDYWPLSRFQPGRRKQLILEKIPFAVLALAACGVTFMVQRHGGAVAEVAELPPGLRAGNILLSYVRYLGKLFWPADLAVFYPYSGYWPLPQVLLAATLLAGLTLLCWAGRRRHPWLLFGWLWYLGTLVPVIGLVQVGDQAMADRYTYIPSVGILIILVWAARELARLARVPALTLTVPIAALLSCLIITRLQLRYWQNSESLFRHALAVTRNNFLAHFNLGCDLLNRGQASPAAQEFRATLRLLPNFAPAHYNLGQALNQQGQAAAAILEFQETLRLQPDYADAHNNLGIAFSQTGRPDQAIHEFQETLRLAPNWAATHYNLGILLLKQGQTSAAHDQFLAAIQCQPDYPEAHNLLGFILAESGQLDDAIVEFQTALQLRPDFPNAHSNLTHALALKNSAK